MSRKQGGDAASICVICHGHMGESHERTDDPGAPTVVSGPRQGTRKARLCRLLTPNRKEPSMAIDFDAESGIGPKDPKKGELTTEEKALLGDIQGNILKSHGRDHSQHLFLKFDTTKANEARAWLVQLATKKVTSALKQWDESLTRAEIFEKSMKKQDPEAYRSDELAKKGSSIFINVMLSAKGYDALGLSSKKPKDATFCGGAAGAVSRLADPARKDWEAPYDTADLHALVIVADDDPGRVDAEAKAIAASLKGGTVVSTEVGKALRRGKNGPVHEHFGFVDGVSNPLFFAKDIPQKSDDIKRWNPGAGLNLALAKDPGGKATTGYGSFLVYRKLEQDINQFNKDRHELAKALAKEDQRTEPNHADWQLAGAYMVGRFPDGFPVSEKATPEGANNDIPNNFNFDADTKGLKCPFQSHIRKTNPRGDTTKLGETLKKERTHRISRRAISYEKKGKVGLLFLCVQKNIETQFEFMQKLWVNNPTFVQQNPRTGLDPLIGQGTPESQQWPAKYGSEKKIPLSLQQSVHMRGGEYFFLPSMSCLMSMATTS
ncbi:Dyp-type peroxidase [Streptomyces piniterrae]|nr:Dyp-type peroxidase domain-containing protein [Streptomyces piniterrae]